MLYLESYFRDDYWMNENVYQHFKNDERDTIDKIESLIAKADVNYHPVLTDFFNPRERFIAKSVLGNYEGIKMTSFGGIHHADRKRVLFYPNYYQWEKQDFELALLKIDYPEKFAELHHRQILGALVHSGVKRNVIGDIITNGEKWQVITEKKISQYLITQVDRIGKINVRLVPQRLRMVINPLNAWEEENTLISSLRVDNLISNAYHISRTRAKELITDSKVQVNWTNVDRPDYLIGQYDIISVRGYGRIRLNYQLGETAKQKLKVNISVIRK